MAELLIVKTSIDKTVIKSDEFLGQPDRSACQNHRVSDWSVNSSVMVFNDSIFKSCFGQKILMI